MNYKRVSVRELQQLCEGYGIDKNGKKEDLIKRLEEYTMKTKDFKTQNLFSDRRVSVADNKNHLVIDSARSYLQINGSNLAYYFNFGIIYPLYLENNAIYKNENRAQDILSKFPNYLIVADGRLENFRNDDVLVEIIMDGIELRKIEETKLAIVTQPIPISRIKSIYFSSESELRSFLASTEVFPDAFIPSSICKVIDNEIPEVKIDFNSLKVDRVDFVTDNDWKFKLESYDRILGMFSFMKNSGLLNAERENDLQEYTNTFFSALQHINLTSKLSVFKEVSLYRYILKPEDIEINSAQRFIFKQIIDRIYSNQEFDLSIGIEILNKALESGSAKEGEVSDIHIIIDWFQRLEQLKVSYKDLLQQELIRKNYPILALLILSKFPNKSRQNTDKQAVRNIFIDSSFEISKSISEFVLAILGLYYGYSTMVKQDTNLRFEDKYLEIVAKKVQSIKIKLNSHLDRFIVESVFEYVVNKRPALGDFKYLNINPVPSLNIPTPPTSIDYEYTIQISEVLGTNVLNLRRSNKFDRIISQINEKYGDVIDGSSYLSFFLAKNVGWQKDESIVLLKKLSQRISIDEIEKIIELDHQKKGKQ